MTMPIVFLYIIFSILFVSVSLLARNLSKTNIKLEKLENLDDARDDLDELVNTVSDQVDDLEFKFDDHMKRFHAKKTKSSKKGV